MMAEGQLGELGSNIYQLGARFSDVQPLGYGSGGLVYSAQDNQRGQMVCLKKFVFHDQRSCQKVLREVRILRQLRHDNIVTLHEVLDDAGVKLTFGDARSSELKVVYFIQDLLQTDLNQLIRKRQLGPAHIQLLMYQLLRGLKYLHSANVLHRDLKPSNLFVSCDTMLLKVGDFGTSRVLDPAYKHAGHLTSHVGTCWYMSPEALLLSPKDYTTATDLWSAGCIIAECFLSAAIFQGAHELDQMLRIIDGVHLTDADWTEVFRVMPNKLLKNQPLRPRTPLRQRLQGIDTHALDVIECLLTFNPKSRLSAAEALQHPYFSHYACDDDEPVAHRPFHIEHEVDDLPLSTLQALLIKECHLANGDSLGDHNQLIQMPSGSGSTSQAALPSAFEASKEETHTLDEIFQMSSTPDDWYEDEQSGLKHIRNVHHSHISSGANSVQLENMRNMQTQHSINIFHVSKETEEGGFKKCGKNDEANEEKDVADCSPRKIREDLELSMNELINKTQMLTVNNTSSEDISAIRNGANHRVLTIEVDPIENCKEYSQRSPKSQSPQDAACGVSNEPNNELSHGICLRSHVMWPWNAVSRSSMHNRPGAQDSNKEEFSKKQLKAETVSSTSRKLILDKIETEKGQNMAESRHHSGLTSEEFDEIYRLPTDHLSLNRDISNQSFKNRQHLKNKRGRRSIQPWHCQDRERFKEEMYLEGACGGYEHSPEHSDQSDEDPRHHLRADSMCIVPPAATRSTYDIDISLSVLPGAPSQQAHSVRDPLSSPESPPSPSGGRSGARPKKSPKKQRAL